MLKTSELAAAQLERDLATCFGDAPVANLQQMAKLGVHVFNPAAEKPTTAIVANLQFDMAS